jgi:4-amino-4-deoxy-L-arabinose transferase-like glycosyltransferase
MLEWMSFFTRLDHLTRSQTVWWLIGCCIILLILWLPGLEYPVWADTAYYALLGESIWTTGTYALNGVPHAKFLPLHALYSYPFTAVFGIGLGMKVSTLVAGWGVLITSFLLLKETVSKKAGLLVTFLLLLQPAFLLLTMFGGSDLLFTLLLLASALFFVKAERNQRMYLWAGLLLGAACLTRYNGVPMFGVYTLWMLWKRPHHLKHAWSWIGLCAGILVFSTWFIRNAIVFGDPLHTDYLVVQDAHSPSIMEQIFRSIVYYGNPLHSVLPLLLTFAVWGIVRLGRKQILPMLIMLGGWALALIWWSKGMRYLVPTMPILLGFSILGFTDIYEQLKNKQVILWVTCALLLMTHLPMLCVYSYGACNAWMDRNIGFLPPNMGLTQEGMHMWNEGVRYVNKEMPAYAIVTTDLDAAEVAVLEDTFRSDLHITERGNPACASYKLTQSGAIDGSILFESISQPTTRVLKMRCPDGVR